MEEELKQAIGTWSALAWGIEETHGDDDPAAKALRKCCRDIQEVLNKNRLEEWKRDPHSPCYEGRR